MKTSGKRIHPDDNMAAADSDKFTAANAKFAAKRQRRLNNRKKRKVTSNPAAAGMSQEMNKLIDDTLDYVSQPPTNNNGDNNESISDDDDMDTSDGDVAALSAEVIKLRKQVLALQQQMDFVLSCVGIPNATPPSTTNITMHDNAGGAHSAAAPVKSYATATSRTLQGPVREAVVAAVYADLRAKENRTCNIVVTGLRPTADTNDNELFTQLCSRDLNITIKTTHCHRLGKSQPGKSQPLLVVLENPTAAHLTLSRAKALRESTDAYTRQHVYISAHLTRAESQAAFEERCRRREQAARKQQRAGHLESHGAVGAAADNHVDNHLPHSTTLPASKPAATNNAGKTALPQLSSGSSLAASIAVGASSNILPAKSSSCPTAGQRVDAPDFVPFLFNFPADVGAPGAAPAAGSCD